MVPAHQLEPSLLPNSLSFKKEIRATVPLKGRNTQHYPKNNLNLCIKHMCVRLLNTYAHCTMHIYSKETRNYVIPAPKVTGFFMQRF